MTASYLSYKNDLSRSVFGLKQEVMDNVINSNFIDLEKKVNHYSDALGAQVYFSKNIERKFKCVLSTHFPIQIDGLVVGYISDCPSYTFLLTYLLKRSILIYFFSFILVMFLMQLILYKRSIGKFISLIKNKNNIESIDVNSLEPAVEELYSIILKLVNAEEKYKKLYVDSRLNEKIAVLSKQVAHDIRSPLSSLNMISSALGNLPEEQKNILTHSIDRINSIANDLLEKGKGNFEDPKINLINSSLTQNKFYLLPMLKSIITEKRAQYKNKSDVFIIFNNRYNVDDLTSFPKSELERILSNIINNATESLINDKGEIEISLYKTDSKFNLIAIKDNGKGVPEEVLSKIGQKGFSYGKEHLDQSGSGLGLYHAKKTMQEFGGELLIDSELGKGTTITLKIPLADQ